MSRKITKDWPIYQEIVDFLNQHGMHNYKDFRMTKTKRINVIFPGGKMKILEKVPQNWALNIGHEDYIKIRNLMNWFHEKSCLQRFFQDNFVIPENVSLDFNSINNNYTTFKCIFRYFGNVTELEYPYTIFLCQDDLFQDYGINLNVIKLITEQILKENATKLSLDCFHEVIRNKKIQYDKKAINSELKKHFNNLQVKDSILYVKINRKSFATQKNIGDLLPHDAFIAKTVDFYGVEIITDLILKDECINALMTAILVNINTNGFHISYKAHTAYYDYVKKINERNDILYTSLEDLNIKIDAIVMYNPKDGCYLSTENNDLVITQKQETISIDLKNHQEKFEFIMSDKYLDCLKLLNNITKNNSLQFSKGEGLLFGNTSAIVDNDYEITFEVPSILVSEEEWKKEIQLISSNIKKLKEKAKRKDYEKLRDVNISLYGSSLTESIMEMVKKNEDYITRNAVIQSLQGKRIGLNAPIREVERSGKYNSISSDEISKIIDLLVKYEYLKEKGLRGSYGRFYLLKLTKKELPKFSVDEEILEYHIQNNDTLCFYDLEYIFKKENKTAEENIALLDAINNLEFLCFYKKEYVSYMRQFENFKLMFQMKLDTGFYDNDDKLRKIVKEIVKK